MSRTPMGLRLGAAIATAALLAACQDGSRSTPLAPSDAPSFALSVGSSNFQQCANGDNGDLSCTYINGVLNDSKSLYHESDVIAQRFVIPGLVANRTYQLVFDYGWEKAVNPGHMNYDFIAGWNVTLGTLANPCGDPLGNGASDIRGICNANGTIRADWAATAGSWNIPTTVFTANAPLGLDAELGAAINRFKGVHGANAVRFDILGGSFPDHAVDNVTYTVNGDDVTGRITVRFTAVKSTVMLLWGGHFADGRDYRLAVWDADKNPATAQVSGNLTGAAGQSGAPFHFTQQSIKDLATNEVTGIGSLSNNVQGSVLEPVPKASIAIAASAVNGIGEPHTFTVTLRKDLDDGSGPVAAVGEHVDVLLTPAGGALVTPNAALSTCDNAGANTDANGQCTIVFTSNSAGTVTGTASATLLIGGKSVMVTTDGAGDNSAGAVKTFVAGTIRWLKHNGSGQLLSGAVFTLCRTHDWDSDANAGAGAYADIVDVCVDVTDNVSGTDDTNASPADQDGTAGEFQAGSLILGKYTVQEKTAPAGYVLDPDTENVDLSTTSASFTITTAFVNIAPDAFITISPNTATNNVGEPHSFTATMTVDPSGGPAPVIGTITIIVSPTPGTLDATQCQPQTGPDQTGLYSRTCTRLINSNVAGTFTANASGSATVGSITLNRDTDPGTAAIVAGAGGSGPATKIYQAPLLSIVKTPDLATNQGGTVHPGGTASFTITVSNSNLTGTGTAKGVVMTDTLPAGLSWTDNRTECLIDQVTVASASRDRITCTIGDLTKGASFAVTVTSSTIPSNFLQTPASSTTNAIEIDGDLADGAAAGKDWASLPASVFSCATPKVGCDIDLPTGRNDNSFGQGTKEDSPIPTVVFGSIPNNKSDLLRFYVASERVLTTNYLYLAWTRVQEPNGTTNMDFELNQSASQHDNGTPVRTAGDILVRYDLSQGGTNPQLSYHKWVTSGPSSQCEASNSVPCWGTKQALTNDVDADINSGPVTDIGGGTLSERTFGEASINLNNFFDPGVCRSFGQAYLKSRSSDAFGSEMKDFIAPIPVNITTCAPVTLNNTAWASATNFTPAGGNLGDPISDTGKIEVTESGSASLFSAPTGVGLARANVPGLLTAGVGLALMDQVAQVGGTLDVQRAGEVRGSFAEQAGGESAPVPERVDGDGSLTTAFGRTDRAIQRE